MLEEKFDGWNELLDKDCVHTHGCLSRSVRERKRGREKRELSDRFFSPRLTAVPLTERPRFESFLI